LHQQARQAPARSRRAASRSLSDGRLTWPCAGYVDNGSHTLRGDILTVRDDAPGDSILTFTDKLLIVAMSWAALLAFAVLIRIVPKWLSPDNHAVSPLVWVVLGSVGVVSAVGVLGTEPNTFYFVALAFLLAVYVATVAIRRRQTGRRLNGR
jgi:uncharacterized membrane protein